MVDMIIDEEGKKGKGRWDEIEEKIMGVKEKGIEEEVEES